MSTRWVFLAAVFAMVGISTAASAAHRPISDAPRREQHVAARPPLQPENAPPVSQAWVLPQGWPHTP